MSRELMQQALEALEDVPYMSNKDDYERLERVTTALRQALETEPFEYWNAVEGWVKIDEVREHFDAVGCGTIYKSAGEGRSPLYTAPPKRDLTCVCGAVWEGETMVHPPREREWVGLTEREVELIDEMIETQLLHAERCDHMANSTMAQKQKAWNLERVELLRMLKEKNT